MTDLEILNELVNRQIIIDKQYDYRKIYNSKNADLRALIMSNFNEFDTLNEKIWHLLNLELNRPTCIICDKKTAFKSITSGYRKCCSQKCSALSDNRKEKIKNTSLKKYGVEHPTQSQKYRDTCKSRDIELGYHPGGFSTPENINAIREKYGVDNVFQSKKIKHKIKETMREKYGVDNPQQNKEIREKTEQTKLSKYGNKGWNPAKVKETLMAIYGVDNPLKSAIIREKIKKTSQLRYGTDYPIQHPEIFEKCQKAQSKTRYKFKDFKMPSGDIRKVQGYEPQVINYLLQSDIAENDLKTARTEVPTIKYNLDGKNRIYFPDIFIPSKNLLIEVKSGYTWNKDAVKNLAKQSAAKDHGFNHIIIIWDDNRDCIKKII